MPHDVWLAAPDGCLAGTQLRKFVAPEFVFGHGARHLAGRYAYNHGARHALVVSDPGVVDAGWTGEVIESLQDAGVAHTLYTHASENPRADESMRGATVYADAECDAMVAVGGGSPMDCAKGIGVVVACGAEVLDYVGVDRITSPLPPLICVPTTAGSSADVSQFAIILNERRAVKEALISKALVPDASLIDPETLVTKGATLTAHTGYDALCHALEAFVSNASSPMTDRHALYAVRLITSGLVRCIDDPYDLEARTRVAMGSLEAGLAFSNASLGLVHAMAHSLGGLLDLPHGSVHAVLLPHVVAFNFGAAEERYGVLDKLLGEVGLEAHEGSVGEALAVRLRRFGESVGLGGTLASLGVRPGNIPDLARHAMADPCVVTNPRRPTLQDVEHVYEQAF